MILSLLANNFVQTADKIRPEVLISEELGTVDNKCIEQLKKREDNGVTSFVGNCKHNATKIVDNNRTNEWILTSGKHSK